MSQLVPDGVPFNVINRHLKKKQLVELIDHSYRQAGNVKTITMLDELKHIGYQYATEAGFSISIDDMVIPEEKSDLLKQAQIKVNEINSQHQDGLITDGERYNQVIDIWARTTELISEKMSEGLYVIYRSCAQNQLPKWGSSVTQIDPNQFWPNQMGSNLVY